MSFTESVHAFFVNYVNFRGRASRSEFWWAMLFVFLASLAAQAMDGAVGMWAAYPLFCLAIFLPQLSVQVRRLHDVGRTGWWIAVVAAMAFAAVFLLGAAIAGLGKGDDVMVPLFLLAVLCGGVGFVLYVVLLAWFCLRGTEGANRFGPAPLVNAVPLRTGSHGLA